MKYIEIFEGLTASFPKKKYEVYNILKNAGYKCLGSGDHADIYYKKAIMY